MKNNKQPEIRFLGFHEEWEHRKLKEIVIRDIKGKARAQFAGGTSNYLDANRLNGGEIMLVDSPEDVSEEDVIILWDGSQAGTVYHGFKGALGSTLKAYSIDGSGSFVYQQLKKNQQNIYERYRTPNIPHVVKSFAEEYSIFVPDLEEQNQIGTFFKQLDNYITCQQQELTVLKETKQGFLQKMFPKEGERVPEIRFPEFTNDWKQCKLGDVGTVVMNKRIFKEQTLERGEVPFYKIGTFGGTPDAFIPRSLFEEYKLKYPYPEIGDILISASGSIGRTVEYTGKDEYFQDSNIVWLKHDEQLNNSFLKQFYFIVKWHGLEGSTIKRLYNKNILNTAISLPSINEQIKIGTFLKKFDDTIALHQRELELLKETKKAFLQKMFV